MLEKYKAYYATRARRYRDNPHYQNSYIAEKPYQTGFNPNSLDEMGGK